MASDKPAPNFSNFVSGVHLSVATRILRADFGAVVESVCLQLLTFGTQTLVEIAQATRLGTAQLRNALLILIQQNLVKVVPKPDKARPPRVDKRAAAAQAAAAQAAAADGLAKALPAAYEASLEEVFARRWVPCFIVHTRERLGDDCALLLQVRRKDASAVRTRRTPAPHATCSTRGARQAAARSGPQPQCGPQPQ